MKRSERVEVRTVQCIGEPLDFTWGLDFLNISRQASIFFSSIGFRFTKLCPEIFHQRDTQLSPSCEPELLKSVVLFLNFY